MFLRFSYLIFVISILVSVSFAELPSPMADSPKRGEVLITEIAMDDDGIYAALPSQGSNQKSIHSAEVDLVLELHNTTESAIDIKGWKLWYIVEPYDVSDASLQSPANSAYDLCGIKSNSTFGYNILSNTLNVLADASISIAAKDFLVIYENPFEHSREPQDADAEQETFRSKNDVQSASNLSRHQYPIPGVTAYDTPTTKPYDRLFLGHLNNVDPTATNDVEDGIAGHISGCPGSLCSNLADSTKRNYVYWIPRVGAPRTCFGNQFTTDVSFTRNGWSGTDLNFASGANDTAPSDPDPGFFPSQPHRFTIILTDETDAFVDIFSVARNSSDSSAQSNLNAAFVSSDAFDFTPAGPGFPTTADFGSTVDLSQKSWSRKSLDPVTSRDSFYIGDVSLGSFSTFDPGGTVEGNPVWNLDTLNSSVIVLRDPPNPGIASAKPNEGDAKSTFKLNAKINPGGKPMVSSNVKFRLIRTVDGQIFPSNGIYQPLSNISGSNWQATFIPDSTIFDTGAADAEYHLEIRAEDEGGIKSVTTAGSVTFAAKSTGPELKNLTFIPAITDGVTLQLSMGSNLNIQVEAFDFGTVNISDVYFKFETASGSAKPTTYPLVSVGADLYSTNFSLGTPLDVDVIYYLRITGIDEFGNSIVKDFSQYSFKAINAPYLNPNPYPISSLPNQIVTIADLRNSGITLLQSGDINAVTYKVTSVSPLLNSCTLYPSGGNGTPQKLEIATGSAVGTGYCTLTLSLNGQDNVQTVMVDILENTETILNHFKISPPKDPLTGIQFNNEGGAAFNDFVEFEASLTDIDGFNGGSVIMNFVVTDPAETQAQGGVLASVPLTVYRIYMYDDGTDVRAPASAGFGLRYSASTTYVYNDNTALSLESQITPVTGGQEFPTGSSGVPDFKLFKADVNGANDGTFHITMKPYGLAFSTTYQIDLEVKDSGLEQVNFDAVGHVRLWSGPGWVHPSASDPEFKGTESNTNQVITFKLFEYECDAPVSVYGRSCGAKGMPPGNSLSSQGHASLTWTVDSFDTDFFSSVLANSLFGSQDGFDATIKANRCGTGVIHMKVLDSLGYTATTNAFSLNLDCVNNPPIYASEYQAGNPAPLILTEDLTSKTFSLEGIGFEVIEGYSETAKSSMTWIIHTSSTAVNAPNIISANVVGTDLTVEPVANFSHAPGAFDTLVLCVTDDTGLKPANGTLAHPDGTANACVEVRIHISEIDDPPVISINGLRPPTPIPSPVKSLEDQILTTTIGLNDFDGPLGSTKWVAVPVSDPGSIIQTIEFSLQSTVGSTGQLWNMIISPNPNKFGSAIFDITVFTDPSTSDTQRVTFEVAEVNDPFVIVGSPCAPNPIVTSEGFDPITLTMNESVIDDSNDTGEIYVWALSRVDYEGNYYDSSDNQVKPVVGQFNAEGAAGSQQRVDSSEGRDLFDIKLTSNGILTLESIQYASIKSATIQLTVSDRNGAADAFSASAECKLIVNDIGEPPVINTTELLKQDLSFDEDTVFELNLGLFELDSFNPYDQDNFDKNLKWAVKLSESTTLFSIDVAYPATFRSYLHAQNEELGRNQRIALGKVNPDINPGATGPNTVKTSGDVHTTLDPVEDLLYISTAPDVHGTFAIELQLSRLGFSPAPTPVTTILTFTVLPVNDPPAITILNPADDSKDLGSYHLTMLESDSVKYLNLVSWENDARDFVSNKKGGNGVPADSLFWDYSNFFSDDLGVFKVGCPPPLSGNLLDPTTNEILCLRPGTAVDLNSLSIANLHLKLLDNDVPVATQRSIEIRVIGGNDYPIIVGLGGSNPVIVSEDDPNFRKSLIPHAVDEEESLIFEDGKSNINRMNWYFSDVNHGLQFSASSLGSTTFTSFIDNLGTFQILQGSKELIVKPEDNQTGQIKKFMILCDLGIGAENPSIGKLCTSTEVTFIVTNVNDAPLATGLPSVLTTEEGGCISIDLTAYQTDYDNDPLDWSIKPGSVSTVSFDDFVFNFPTIEILSGLLSARPGTQNLACNANIVSASSRAFGSLTMSLLLSDGSTSTEIPMLVSWTPVWTTPTIDLSAAPFNGTSSWIITEDSTSGDVETTLMLQNPAFLKDDDWDGQPRGLGETVGDFSWSIIKDDVVTQSYITSDFSLTILTDVGPIGEDFLQFLPRSNFSTTGVTVTLSVSDSVGLSNQKIIKLVVSEINDTPIFTNFPNRLCTLENVPSNIAQSQIYCFFEDSGIVPVDLSKVSSDALDNPPNPLQWHFTNAPIGEGFEETGAFSCVSGATQIDNGNFTAKVEAQTLKITGNQNRNHASVPNGETLTLCVSDGQLFSTTLVHVYILPLNDDPVIFNPVDGAEIEVLEDTVKKIVLLGNDENDFDFGFDPTHLAWEASKNGQGEPAFTVQPNTQGTELSISAKPNYNSTVLRDWTLTLREIDTPEQRFTSVGIKLKAKPVNDAPQIFVNNGADQLELSVPEDISETHVLKDYLVVVDQESVDLSKPLSDYVIWSFEATADVFEKTFTTDTGKNVKLVLGNPQGINSVAFLQAETMFAETTGILQNVKLFVRDKAENPILSDSVNLIYRFLSENDPPQIDAKIPEDGFKVGSDGSIPLEIDLRSWKIDADTPQRQLCFDVAFYDASKILPTFPDDYGPAVANQDNCISDVLKIFTVPGALGSTQLKLSLIDTVDLQHVEQWITIKIVSSKPVFNQDLLSQAALTFVSDITKQIKLEDLIIDDKSIGGQVLSSITDDPGEGGFYLNTSQLNNLAFIDFSSGNLRINPSYESLSDGSADFELKYKDSEGNLAEVTATLTKKHAFLKWAYFDDVDGNGAYGLGDRIRLQFSASSEGVVGVTEINPVVGSTSAENLTTSNFTHVIKGISSDIENSRAFGDSIKRLDFLNDRLQAVTNPPYHYVEVTLNEGFDINLQRIAASHRVQGSTTKALVYHSGLIGSDGEVALDKSTDAVRPRLVSAYLVDADGNSLVQFDSHDRIDLYFSETIANLPSEFGKAFMLDDNSNVGSNPVISQERNKVMIQLGANALIRSAFGPSIQALNTVKDLVGNPVDFNDVPVLLRTNDDLGPVLVQIHYDQRSQGVGTYKPGDRIYLYFNEAIDSSSLNSNNLAGQIDRDLGLQGGQTFGLNASVEWQDNDTVLMITLGSGASGLSASTRIKPSINIKDKFGNAYDRNRPTTDFGINLPEIDTVAPTVRLAFYRNNLELDRNDLDFVGPGLLEIRAFFSDIQTSTPQLKISNGSLIVTSGVMNFSSSGNYYFYSYSVTVADGQNSLDGLHLVTVTGDSDAVSGESLEILKPDSFNADTAAPVISLNPFGRLESIQGQDKNVTGTREITITGSANENIDSLQFQMISPSAGVFIEGDLKSGSLQEFAFRLSKLQVGNNLFKILVRDLAGNQSEVQNQIYYLVDNATIDPQGPVDLDDDGVINSEDAFPSDPSEQYDTDGDGLGDNRDLDDDGDEILDIAETQILLNGVILDLSLDSDNDGIPNLFDTDDDGDGILDKDEEGYVSEYKVAGKVIDFDNDGLPNATDIDDDNDGLNDSLERQIGTNQFNPDTDGDSSNDGSDIAPLDPLNPNPIPNSIPFTCRKPYDLASTDFDQDGVLNIHDQYPFDHDNDGIADHIDCDDDGDGIEDGEDEIAIFSEQDYDGDGILNQQDSYPCDINNDGVPESSFGGGLNRFGMAYDRDNDCIEDKNDTDKDGDKIPDQLNSMIDAGVGELIEVAIPKDAFGNVLLSIASTGLETEILYDTSLLSDDYKELRTLKLQPDKDLRDVVPVILVKNTIEAQKFKDTDLPSGFETLGKVISIKGKIEPNQTVNFPFPLPSYLQFDNTLSAADLRLEFFTPDQNNPSTGEWRQAGTGLNISSGVLYAEISHFSEWRVLRNTNNIFSNNPGSQLASTSGGGGGGCYIVTASSGNANHWLVHWFSKFRDEFLLCNSTGKYLVQGYYTYAPSIAGLIKASNVLQWISFSLLTLLIPISAFLLYWQISLLILISVLLFMGLKRYQRLIT